MRDAHKPKRITSMNK